MKSQLLLEIFLFFLVVIIIPLGMLFLCQPMYDYYVNESNDGGLVQEDYYVGGLRCDKICRSRELQPHKSIDLSIVIPAYNEVQRLPLMIEPTMDFLKEYSSRYRLNYEIIVVDDYSSDDTSKLVLTYAEGEELKRRAQEQSSGREKDDDNEEGGDEGKDCTGEEGTCTKAKTSIRNTPADIRLVQLKSNKGKGGAIKRGVLFARGHYILFADADGATDIKSLEKLMNSLKEIEKVDHHMGKVGMSIGSRAHLEKDSISQRKWYRTILMHGFHLLVSLLCTDQIKDTQCGFKLFTKSAAKILFSNLHLEGWAFDTEIIYLAESLNIPISEVAVHWQEVEGSKLIQTKLDVVKASLYMARDMLCLRMAYLFRIWDIHVKKV